MSDKQNLENEIMVSFDDVKMKDFRAYWKAVAKGDWQGQDAFFAKVVKAWAFEGDPSDVETYSELSLLEYNQVQVAIREISSTTRGNIRR